MNIRNLRRSTLATALVLGVAWGAAGAATAATSVSVGVHIGGRTSVDIDFFYSNLQPYGRWVERSHYGRVFVPRVSRTSWRPYSLGHWVDTDYGWTWISDEPFGWATYHYGRWYFDPDLGWVWVPGTEWGPAWVDFQEADDYIGWAPLPPTVEFDYGSGLDYGGFRAGYDVPYNSYCFVEERRFLEPRIATYIAPPTRNVDFFRRARRITSYAVENQRVINRSVPVPRIERAIGRRVARFQVADVGGTTPVRQPRFRGNRVELYRPQVQVAQRANAPGVPRFDGRAFAQRQARERRAQVAAPPARMQAEQQRRAEQNARRQAQQQQQIQRQQQQQQQIQRRQVREQQQQQQVQRRQIREQQQQQQVQRRQIREQQQQQQVQRRQIREQQQQQQIQRRQMREQQQQQQVQRRQAQMQQQEQRRQGREQQMRQQNEQRRQAQAQMQQQRRQAREQQRPPQAQNRGGGRPDRPPHGGGQGKPHGHRPPGGDGR